MFFGMKLQMAARERQLIHDRTCYSQEQIRKNGRCAAGNRTLPFGIGYNRKEEFYYPTEDAARVKHLFQLFTSGVTNFRDLTLKTGITYFRIRPILENTAYHRNSHLL